MEIKLCKHKMFALSCELCRHINNLCEHKRNALFCVLCRYGNTGHHHESCDEENPKDLVNEINKTTKYRKLKEYYEEKDDL